MCDPQARALSVGHPRDPIGHAGPLYGHGQKAVLRFAVAEVSTRSWSGSHDGAVAFATGASSGWASPMYRRTLIHIQLVHGYERRTQTCGVRRGARSGGPPLLRREFEMLGVSRRDQTLLQPPVDIAVDERHDAVISIGGDDLDGPGRSNTDEADPALSSPRSITTST